MQLYTSIRSNKKAILFFAGWGMDENPFMHMEHKGYDLYIFHNYSTLSFSTCPEDEVCNPECREICVMQQIFNMYHEIVIIGWGLGVWCASAAFDKYLMRLNRMGHFSELKFWAKIKRCIAINGTLMPISKVWGISPHSYLRTMELLPDKTVFDKFLHRMCRTKKEYDFYMSHAPKRDPLQSKEELCTIYNHLFMSNSLTWDTAIIGDSDLIFYTARQRTFWENYAEIAPGGCIPGTRKRFNLRSIQLEGSHFLFSRFGSWNEIIAL